MSRPPRNPGPIPNRWLYCPRIAESFIADKFLAFKTPLADKFHDQMRTECRFTPEMVFSFSKMFKAKIGMWIDLTNTSRFYDRKSIEDREVQYIKLNCRGHGETPSTEQTRSFIEFVDQFIAAKPMDMIGVHCTHGFNRTGFLIVSYMVEKMDCSVEAALMAFAKARPPGIYKSDYIKELFHRYDDEDDAPCAPQMPDWCFENHGQDDEDDDNKRNSYNGAQDSRKRKLDSPSDDQSNDAADETNLDDQGSDNAASSSSTSSAPVKKKRRKEHFNPNATFMEDVPGVILVTDKARLSEIQVKVQDMCDWTNGGFPGCQPVSMDTKNLSLLSLKPYRVSWKADGTRYMMLIDDANEIFFLDRDNSVFQVSGLTFPFVSDLRRHLKDTLLDGEMVIDRFQGQKTPRYLVYDIIKYDGKDIKNESYSSRLKCIRKCIVDARIEAMKRGLIRRDREPFSIRLKEFFEITKARNLLGPKFAKTLCHEPDGLIFQPEKLPYTAGACNEVLKWKPSHMNSVDFLLKIGEDKGVGILTKKIGFLFVGRLEQPFSKIKFTKALKDLDNKIIECKYENNNGWVFMRERKDKSYPNSFNTAKAVCESIKSPVTTDILLEFIDTQRYQDEHEIMPPPQQIPRHH